ncbi:MAG: class I SAM-dependent methyltransferase [Lachnospiraceae bacterium]|nr:class I SAM-dependent methyltransferase [Lachnospiraceae bacterium]
MTTNEILTEHYNKFNEDKRLKSRHGQVEFRVSMRYIHEYLKKLGPDAKILDVGAGTGAYSIPLSEEGYEVHALELVKHNVQRLRAAGKQVHALQGNALKLSKKFEKEYFDLVLVFGPMYHLFSHEDKLKVLSEASKVLKKGGIMMVAYCMNDYAIVKHGFIEGNIKESVHDNKVDINYNVMLTEDDIYDYVTIEEIDRLANESGLIRDRLFTPDGPANYIRNNLRDMDEESFELFVSYVETIAERKDMIGAAAHTVDVLIKK